MNNQRGSSLLIVMVIIIVFMILGLAILSAAVNTVHRTEFRELEIHTTSDSKKIMTEIMSKIQYEFQNLSNSFNQSIDFTQLKSPAELKSKTSYDYDILLQQLLAGTASTSVKQQILKMYEDTNQIVDLQIKDIREFPNEDITDYISDYNEATYKDNFFTRIYKVQLTVQESENARNVNRTLEQRFILSPTPSFLQYAIGSKGKVVINGSPDVIGDMYTPSLELNSRAKYYIEDEHDESTINEEDTGSFNGPAIYGTLFVNGLENNRKDEVGANPNPFFEGVFTERDSGITGIPIIKATQTQDFIDMNFETTFVNKWQESRIPTTIDTNFLTTDTNNLVATCTNEDPLFEALIETNGLIDSPAPPSGNYDYLYEIMEKDQEIRSNEDGQKRLFYNPKFDCGSDFYLIEDAMLESYRNYSSLLFETDIKGTNSILYFTNIEAEDAHTYKELNDKELVLPNGLQLKNSSGEKGWLVVNGSLIIKGGCNPTIDTEDGGCQDGEDPNVIEGNIIVNGDLIIEPNGDKNTVFFDSTVYVSGASLISDINVYGAGEEAPKQLVLMSKNDLKITKINEFKDVSSTKKVADRLNEPANLKAVFYTDGNATLYGVGSLFEIDGGVFADKELTINAIRYNFNADDIEEAKLAQSELNPENELNSRFYVEYDKKVILDQLDSLPRVERLQVIVDDLVIK